MTLWLMMIAVDLYIIDRHLSFLVAVDQIVWVSLIAAVLTVPWLSPLVNGRLYAIHYFRAFGFSLGIIHSALVIYALYLWISGTFVPDSGFSPLFMLIVLLVLSPLTILYVRALLVVRWLDPNSRREEWEPPAYKDPRSWFYKK